MINSESFNRAFKIGFAKTSTPEYVHKEKGRATKLRIDVGADSISMWFRVNPKSSSNPFNPGEFCPEILSSNRRYDQSDRGMVSWYQYSTNAINERFHDMQYTVFEKFSNYCSRETQDFLDPFLAANLEMMKANISQSFAPNRPHSALFYTDDRDAENWGRLFAECIPDWVENYKANPETLTEYMWRTHWNDNKNKYMKQQTV